MPRLDVQYPDEMVPSGLEGRAASVSSPVFVFKPEFTLTFDFNCSIFASFS
jgi:hypothetical protein